MKDKRPEILYSDQLNEIISTPPRKIIRWGTVITCSIFSLLVFLSWVIRYPDVIPATIEITTRNPPVTLVSKVTGYINKLHVTDSARVKRGQLLAVMESTASPGQVNLLKSLIDKVKDVKNLSPDDVPFLSGLGEIQPFYSSFMKAHADYYSYLANDYYGNKIISISEELSALHDYIGRMRTREKLLHENLALETKKFRRDSMLFNERLLPESDFEKSRQARNEVGMELQQAGLDRSEKTIELASKRQLLQDYGITREEEKITLLSALVEAFLNLEAQVRAWENKYLFISPVDGTVTLTRFWTENQSVLTDQPVLNIVPDEPGEYIGRIFLSMQRSGKVKPGMRVNIKLSGFPYLEYGMIRGVIRTRSLVPSGNEYIIEVSLPDGLRTLYGKELEFTQNMQGTAEIMTNELRLLQKIMNPLRHVISKNRD